MRFIIDENVPNLVADKLIHLGHDVVFATRSKSDISISRQSLIEKRIIITLDKDFTNTILFPPAKFNILQVSIHPPDKEVVAGAVLKIIRKIKPSNFKGLIILNKEGFIRYSK